jgi:hypothetical protein
MKVSVFHLVSNHVSSILDPYRRSRRYDFEANDLVQKIRSLQTKANRWADSARHRLQSKEKMSMIEAKTLFDEAEKLNIICDESKALRNAMRSAKGWSNRVKRSKVDQGVTHVDDVKALLDEHDSLLISLPEEVTRLRQAMKSYCICRRPYDGFMIGCDDCDEWYHGPCIGVTESRADRFNKYSCIRCCITKSYKVSAAHAASLIRKWTSIKERKKARQVEAQKHQRKVRKETKEIEKLQVRIQEIEQFIGGVSKLGMQGILESNLECDSPSVADNDGGTSHALEKSICTAESESDKKIIPQDSSDSPQCVEEKAASTSDDAIASDMPLNDEGKIFLCLLDKLRRLTSHYRRS